MRTREIKKLGFKVQEVVDNVKVVGTVDLDSVRDITDLENVVKQEGTQHEVIDNKLDFTESFAYYNVSRGNKVILSKVSIEDVIGFFNSSEYLIHCK